MPAVQHATDPRSGLEIVRLVGGTSLSRPMGYDWPSITPDNRYVIVYCEFPAEAGMSDGFYRVGSGGSDPSFVAPGSIHPRLTTDGKHLYLLGQGDPVVRRADVETGDTVDVCDLSGVLPDGWVYVQARLSPATNHLFVSLREPDTVPIRVDLATGEAIRMDGVDGMLWACAVDEGRLIVVRQRHAERGRAYSYMEYRKLELEEGDRSIWSLDVDGGDERLIGADPYSHATMHGRTSSVQGCGKWGNNSITLLSETDRRRVVCAGPYFWHSGASFDGEWIVADTNWPDYGIQLIHVPTGNFRFLCDHGSSLATGLLHAHPSLSNDGRIALFRSDRSGACQAYLVRIPDDFRASVVAGVSDAPDGGWVVKE